MWTHSANFEKISETDFYQNLSFGRPQTPLEFFEKKSRKDNKMTKQRKRNCLLKFYVSEEEKAFIFEKMKIAKINNLSAYLRKAAIDEKIEIHDYSGLKEINYNLRKIGVNINQIAKRINETNSVYQSDMEDIQRKVNEVWHILTFIQSRLHLENQ